MTQSNYPARQQGTTISKKLHYTDFQQVRNVCHRLREQGVFKHASAADVDEHGSFVVITYVDPTVVEVQRKSSSTEMVPIPPPRRLELTRHANPAPKPIHKRWWFAPSVILGFLAVLCGAGYWAFQQLKQISAPNIGAGVIGFLFVVVLVVAIIKKINGGGGKGHGGGYGFHYGPCD